MRAVRFLLIAIAGLLVLALLAAWQVPGRLDWNRYRATIEALASTTLGRPVTIAGPITLSLLPETELTAADVMVGGNAAGAGPIAPALTVQALRLRVAPLALLSGRVDARELALSGPDLVVDWPVQPGELTGWPPYWLSAFSARIEKGRLRVGGLVLDGINATLETTEAGGLIAAGAGRLGGRQSGSGSGQAIRFTARVTASGNDGAVGLNLAVEAQDRLAGMTGGFAGQRAGDGALVGRIDLSGPDLSRLIAPPAGKPPAGASAPTPPEGAAPPAAFKIGAGVKATGDRADFNDLTIDLGAPNGATSLHGTASLRLTPEPRLEASLSTARLELDPWVKLLGREAASGLAVGLHLKAEAIGFGGGLMRQLTATLEVTQAQIALSDVAVQLPGEADLRLAGVVQRGDPARPRFEGNVQLTAPRLHEVLRWLDGAGIRLLPDLPEAVLTSADFRAHAVAEPGLLALDRIEGRLDGTPVNGELRLWPRLRAAAAGENMAAGAPGNGPAIMASLELGTLQLDPWLPDPLPHLADFGRGFDIDLRLRTPLATWRGEKITWLSLDAAVQSSSQITPVQNGSSPGGTGTGGPGTGGTATGGPGTGAAGPSASSPPAPPPGSATPAPPAAPVQGTQTAGQPAAPMAGVGRLTLRQLEGTIRGVHLIGSGTVAEGGRLTEGKLQANTNDASALADLLAPAWQPADGFWRGPASLNAQLAGPADALGLKLTLDIADARLEAQPVIDLGHGKWAGSVTLRHPGAPRLLSKLGLPGAEAWLGEGSLSMIAHLSGALGSRAAGAGGIGRVSADLLDVTAGLLRLSAPLALDLTGEAPLLSGRIQADTLALPEPAWRDGAPLPFTLLSGWRASVPVTARQVLLGLVPRLTQAAGTVSLADGVLRLDPFTAVLAGGALSGTLVANAIADPPTVAVTAALSDAAIGVAAEGSGSLPLDLLAGQVNAAVDVAAVGHSPTAMLATLSGGMTLNVADGVLSGFDLFHVTHAVATAQPSTRPATEAALRDALAGGVTNFDRLAIRAEAQSGTLLLREGTLAGNAGSAEFSGSVGLGARVLDLRVALHPAIEAPPEIAVRLTGPWEKPRRSPELAGFLRWLAARPALGPAKLLAPANP